MSFRSLTAEWFDYEEYSERKLELVRKLGLTIKEENFITDKEAGEIVEITSRESNDLEHHEKNHFINNAKDGILKVYNSEDELKGFIFAHKWMVEGVEFYERGTLWIDRSLRRHWIGKFLMYKMTKKLEWKGIISVTAHQGVQDINRKLMGYEIDKPKGLLEKIVLAGWPINETYKVYVNDLLMGKIKAVEEK